MKKWIVKLEDERPAGKGSGYCFYCLSEVGKEHATDCVIRTRKVLIKMTIEFPYETVESWDKKQIEFQLNEGTWCASNIIAKLKEFDKKMGCLCQFAEFKYLRELNPKLI